MTRGDFEMRESVFPSLTFPDVSPKEVRHQLLAVTNAEHRRARGEQLGIDGGASEVVDASGATRNDNALSSGERRDGGFAGRDVSVHT